MEQVKNGTFPLPVQPTPFVGRAQEIAEITHLLTDPACRLVTLTGLGGIGKTRLALALAGQLGDSFCNVYYVALQAVGAPEHIINAVAEAIGLPISESGDPRQQLLDYLRDDNALLVMDNFEHLLDGAAIVNDILVCAPDVKILATSRFALNLQEEWLYQVSGMSVPDGNPQDWEASSAVQLFIQSARRTRADFSPEAEHAGISRICKLVDGMPLALELAASWVRSLSCDEIADEITRSLDFLETPIRNMPPRHRNMRAVLEQTWKLLTDSERDVFKQLSVFRGGFTREAAQAVAGASLRTLGSFVDKSLLRRCEDGRYDLHELVQQFAQEQLDTSPDDSQQTHHHHCRYFAEFLDRRWYALTGKYTKEALAEIEGEIENIRTAWNWAVDNQQEAEIDLALDSLWFFYDTKSWYREAERAFARAADTLRYHAESSILLGRLLARQGSIHFSLDMLDKADQLLSDSLAMLERHNGRRDMAFSYLKLSEVACQRRQFDRARQLQEQALPIFRESGDNWGTAFTLFWLSIYYSENGDQQTTEQLIRESLSISEATGNRWVTALSLDALGYVAYHENRMAEAKTCALDCLAICRDIGLRWGIPLALRLLALAQHELGEHRETWNSLHQALNLSVELQLTAFILDTLADGASYAAERGHKVWGVELMTAVFNHPSGRQIGRWAHEVLARLQADLSPEVFAAAAERGRTTNFNTYVQAALTDPSILEHGFNSDTPEAASPSTDLLTGRELEILQLVAAGLSNREIAERLIFSVGTVKWYINQIYSKLQVASRTQAVARARKMGLLA
ncbi:MAG: AAA family ATPase [Anaerolineae bacterium]|nr:AAA family ATPase [Anaerolineae bacterium]